MEYLPVVLNKNKKSIQVTVRSCKGKKIYFQLKKGARTYQGKAFQIPHAYMPTTKKYVDILEG